MLTHKARVCKLCVTILQTLRNPFCKLCVTNLACMQTLRNHFANFASVTLFVSNLSSNLVTTSHLFAPNHTQHHITTPCRAADLSSRCATGSSSCLAAILSSSCLLTEPRSRCLVAPAGCCVASRRVAVSSSRRAAALLSYCSPLTAPPSCCLVMLAGCCVASCRDTVLSSRCAAHSRPFVVLSLRHPLVASSRRLVVASPLASPPPSHPLVVLPHSRPTVVLSLRRLLVASSLRRDWHWWHPRLRTGVPRSQGGAPAGTDRVSGTMSSPACSSATRRSWFGRQPCPALIRE